MSTDFCLLNTRAAAHQSRIKASGSLTTDSLFLQHACVCMQALTMASLLMPRTCVCVCANERHAAKLQQHSFPQSTCLYVSATRVRVKSHMHEYHKIIAYNQETSQATGTVTTDSLLLQHTCVCAIIDHGFSAQSCAAYPCVCDCEMTCAQALAVLAGPIAPPPFATNMFATPDTTDKHHKPEP